jgi:hypothetical protein
MIRLFKALTITLRNYWTARKARSQRYRPLDLGFRVYDEQETRVRISIPNNRRAEHIAILGKTGTGKSSLLRFFLKQDIQAGRGFACFDLHGDLTSFVLSVVAAQEKTFKHQLSDRLIIIEPADSEFSVGLNPLEQVSGSERFVQIAGFAQVLKQRWRLDAFGARTDELLRNSLCVLAENGLTLLELATFLSHVGLRAKYLERSTNPEIKEYFVSRFDKISEPMRVNMCEPILNKTSAFTADPHFRHIVGQEHSTFSVLDAMDRGQWIILNLDKGKLGEEAITLGSLFLTMIKNALFARKKREVFTLYCDEIQNLVSYGRGLETILSEARKFGVSVVSANQFLDQYSFEMRSAILAVGTHIFFRLSSLDAQQVTMALDGGKALAELLKNLPRRHMIVKTGFERRMEGVVPVLNDPQVDFSGLYQRCRERWARKRSEVDQDIAARQKVEKQSTLNQLHDWD